MKFSRGGASPTAANLFQRGGELGAILRSYNWAASPLGPVAGWPRSLVLSIRIMLNSRQPIWIGWGEDLIFFYNDPYKSIIGGRHPVAFGLPAREVWPDIWQEIGPMLDTAMSGDVGTYVESKLLIMERNGYPEETYYTWSYTPIPDDDGSTGGIFCANSDDTPRVIGERQLKVLREVATGTANARSSEEACRISAAALSCNDRDLLFGLLYIADAGGTTFTLAGSTGVAPGHPAAPPQVFDEQTSPWPLLEAARGGQLTVVTGIEQRFALPLPRGSWDRPATQAALIPIVTPGETGRNAVLVAGLNPCRQLDGGYREFLQLIAGQIAVALTNAQAYAEERRRSEALAELDRAKTTFFSNISHEFRTPLTLMIAPIEDALNDTAEQLPGHQRERIETAHRNSLRLLKLVNALLEFSRIEAGRIDACFEATDLATFTRELASNFRSAIERGSLRYDIDCPALSDLAWVDRDMWETIVLNLISNAFKFTLEGSIVVSLREQQGHFELRVSDTGAGIPAHELPRLFERFRRIEGQPGRSFEGSGIGLALVQELVRLHGGTVAVSSEVRHGTVFVVSIPTGSDHLPPEKIRSRHKHGLAALRTDSYVEEALRWLPDYGAGTGEAVSEAASGAAPEAEKGHILVADDNADMREYIGRLLRGRWRVTLVADGQAALAALRSERPNLVLTDVMMPLMSGFELLQQIRSDPALRDVAVIVLSARAGEEARIEGLDAGADDYLTKPFAARELVARVASNLELARIRREAARELMESEQRFRALVNATSYLIFRMSPDWSELRELRGHNATALAQPVRSGWADEYLLAEEMPAIRAKIEAAIAGRTAIQFEHRVRRSDGSTAWASSRAVPLFDERGEIVEWFGASSDITDRRHAEEHLRLVVNELNHRVKNNLAITLAIAAQTFRASGDISMAHKGFSSRIMALAQANDLLTGERGAGVSLESVIRQAVRPHCHDAARCSVRGPRVDLSTKTALSMSMAMHELSTNALKYGAWSTAEGRVAVTWELSVRDAPGEPRLLLDWREHEGPAVVPPARRGFGSRLIERGLASELGGTVQMLFEPSGLVCRVDVPFGAQGIEAA